MKTLIWRDRVKVVTGEITRPQQMRLQRNIAGMAATLDEMSNDEALLYLDNILAICATRAIYVCVDGVWQTVTAPVEVDADGERLTFETPMPPELFDCLPSSLTTPWLENVESENGYVINRFLSFMKPLTNSTPSSDSTSDSEPSNAP